jgi:ATP-dependent DNA helicase PIF1
MSDEHPVPCEFLTGSAGSGKTFQIKQRIAEDPRYGLLSSTTGVSAINLDTTTVHSQLGWYDTESLKDRYASGALHRRLRALHADGHRNLVIDEISMLHAEQLDLIHQAILECNLGGEKEALTPPLGLVITGDFCQLPPGKGCWAFKAECWEHFAASTARLTKIWRQADQGFLDALNLSRKGDGLSAAAMFKSLGTEFSPGLDLKLEGTTIVAKNDEVDRYNYMRLSAITHKPITLHNTRWGIQTSDWKNIPDVLTVKPTALVMLLANTRDEEGNFLYANGDLAHISDHYEVVGNNSPALTGASVKLLRNSCNHVVPQIIRQNLTKQSPDALTITQCKAQGGREPYFDEEKKRWVLGEVHYWPMRLGYASTVHKSQGLSLDRVQLDIRNGFFGAANLAYVALSRARTIQGMRVVGDPAMLARRIKIDPEVKDWL